MRHNYFNLRDENFQCVITGTVGEVRALSLTALVGPLLGQSLGPEEGDPGPPPLFLPLISLGEDQTPQCYLHPL